MSAPQLPDELVEWGESDVIAWLASLGAGAGLALDLPLYPGPYMEKMPARLGVITIISGAGESMEGIADTPGFQAVVRGEPNDPDSAIKTARRLDWLIRYAPFPMDVSDGAFRLIRAMRSGGGPAVIGSEDDGDSTLVACNYLTEIIR